MKTSPNQIIVIVSKNPADKAHPYTIINLEALNLALATLKGCDLALWLYIAKNQNQYKFALSRAEFCRCTAFSKGSYHNAVANLREKGYLVLKEGTKDTYIFYEGGKNVPSEDDLEIEVTQEKQDQTKEFVF